ncbi:MAG: hypothetical protein LDL13_04940 [Calditerrivibrio sp.]|nr:hypothetical protein [Calditerrivibrio sp.]MCA1980594.1 hypothetical protein [Calditerrivibrio sp.]
MYKFMKKLRYFLFLISFFSLLLCGVSPDLMAKPLDIQGFSPMAVKTLKNIGPTELPEISLRAIKSGIKPAFLKNVNLTLKQNVHWLTDEQSQIIRENAVNGKIREDLLPEIKLNEIYVDPHSLLSIKFIQEESRYLTVMEADEDIVEDISIPEQKVFLNDANIVKLTPGIRASSMKKKSTSLEGTGFTFYFDEQVKLPGYDEEGKLIEVALQGYIVLDAPSIEVKYSKNSGYRFVFYANQEAKVNVKLHAELKKDIKIPLYEYSIPAEGCKVAVGFYLVLGVDGSITLSYGLIQTASVKAGLHGDTSYFIPTSLKTVKDLDFKLKADNFSLSADIKGEGSILAEVIFEVLNKGKVVFDNKIGLLVDVKSSVQGGAGDYLSIKGDGFVRVTGKIKVKSFDKSKDLYEYKYPLFSYSKERTSSYDISISEACAYRDVIRGQIMQGISPYANKSITVKITKASGEEKFVDLNTDKDGKFMASQDLKKGDYVSVKIPGTNKFSSPKESSFPYSNVYIEEANYLQNNIKGYVSSPDGLKKYNGPINIYVERTNNIPIHFSQNISLPSTYSLKLETQVNDGLFQITNFDIRPFDKVYAVIDREGFFIASNKIDTDGINFAVDGSYIQEEDKLSSENSVVIFSYEGSSSPSIYNPYLYVKTEYPYGKKKGDAPQSKEFKLKLRAIQNSKQIIAETGSWEMEFGNYIDQLNSSFEKFKGNYKSSSGNIRYQVFEIVTFFSEGKRFESINLAKKSDEDRKKSILGYVDKSRLNIKGGSFVKEEDTYLKGPFVNVAPISPNNFTADVRINYYSSPTSSSPYSYRNVTFSILNDKQKIDSGGMEPFIIWDKMSKTKVIKYREFPKDEIARYDLEDFIPEINSKQFVQKGTILVNGILCNLWEKEFKANQFVSYKLEIYTAQKSGLPVKVIYYDGSLHRIEYLFSNWNVVKEKI